MRGEEEMSGSENIGGRRREIDWLRGYAVDTRDVHVDQRRGRCHVIIVRRLFRISLFLISHES